MMRSGILAGMTALFLGFGNAEAQDIARLFLPGDPAFQLMGGSSLMRSTSGSTLTNDEQLSSGLADPQHRAFVRYDSRFDNYYREHRRDGTSPSLGGAVHSVQAGISFASGSTLDLLGQSEYLTSQARSTSDQLMNYSNSRKSLRLAYGTPLSRGLRWKVTLGHSDASGSLLQDIGTAVSLSLPNGALSIGLERTTSAQQMGVIVASIRGILPLNHQNLISRVALSTGNESVRFTLAASQTVVSPHHDQRTEDGLRFEPAGYVRQWQSRIEAGLDQTWIAVVTAEGHVFKGRGAFTSNGSGYGMLERADYEEFSAAAGVLRESPGFLFVGDVSWTHINGSLDGRVESWPFVSVLQSPISQRANFGIEGSFRLLRIHAGTVVPLTGWFTLGGGISVLRLMPDLRIESWQAGFLGVGRRAYADRRLSVDRVDGGMVSAGFRMKLGEIGIDYSVNQFIPIHLHKSSLPSGTTSLFTTPEAGAVISSWGGLFQRLGVSWKI